MAVRKPKPETPQQRAVADRVRRANAGSPPRDYTHCYELADALGIDVEAVKDFWDERSGMREWCGGIDRAEAERLGWCDTLDHYDKQRRLV